MVEMHLKALPCINIKDQILLLLSIGVILPELDLHRVLAGLSR